MAEEIPRLIADSQTGFYGGGAYGYMVYDGAGRVFDSHFVGFTTGLTSMFGDIGAATKHTYHRLHGLSFDPAGPPRIDLPDYASATPNYGEVHDLQEPRRWGIALVDEDGTLGGFPGRTLISNHPMMRSSFDVTYPNWVASTGNPSAYLSPYPFAHLRIEHPGWAFPSLPAITLERYLAGHPRVGFLNDYNTDAHKQFPVVVNLPSQAPWVSYNVGWPVLPSNHDVIVTLDDLKQLPDGTSTRLALVVPTAAGTGFGDLATLQVTQNSAPVMQYGSLAQLDAAPVTGYFIDPNAPSPKPLWLRIVKPSGAMTEIVRLSW